MLESQSPSTAMPAIAPTKKTVEPERPLHRGTACLACRKKRAKCDGEYPICGRCLRSQNSSRKGATGGDCIYENPSKSSFTLMKERLTDLEHSNEALHQRFQDSPVSSVPNSALVPRGSHINGMSNNVNHNGSNNMNNDVNSDQSNPASRAVSQAASNSPAYMTPSIKGSRFIPYVPSYASSLNRPSIAAQLRQSTPVAPYFLPLEVMNSLGVVQQPPRPHDQRPPIPSFSQPSFPADTEMDGDNPHVLQLQHQLAAPSFPTHADPQPISFDPPVHGPSTHGDSFIMPDFTSTADLGHLGGQPPNTPLPEYTMSSYSYPNVNVPDQKHKQQHPGPFFADENASSITPYQLPKLVRATTSIDPSWWQNNEPSAEFQVYLMDIFLSHRRQCACEIPVERFLQSVQGPVRDRPHPCFLNAIYMLACWFSYPHDLRSYERIFLQRTRESLVTAIGTGDRLLNYIQGAALLSLYQYGIGNMLEGYNHICAGAQTAIVCGLHQIPSAVFREAAPAEELYTTTSSTWVGNFRRTPFLLSPPRDAVELGERIHAFWSIWILDTSGCATHGLPSMFDPERSDTYITTPLPVPLEHYSNGMVSDATSSTLQDFWASEGHTMMRDAPVTLRIKATAVLTAACRLSTIWGAKASPDLSGQPQPPQDPLSDPTFESRFSHIARTSQTLLASMPPLVNSTNLGGEIIEEWYMAGLDPVMVHAMTVTLCAIVQLHNITASRDAAAYDNCLAAARQTVAISRQIQDLDFFQLDIMLGICWMSTSHVLLRDLERRRRRRQYNECMVIEEELHLLHFVLHKLGQVYPLVEIQAERADTAFRELR